MNEKIITKMHVKDNLVKVMRVNGVDYISLTDLASYINPNDPSELLETGCQQEIHFHSIRYGKN